MSQYTAEKIKTRLQELLPQLPEKDLLLFLKITTYTSLKNNDIIIPADNATKKAFFILDGIARGYLMSDKGEEKTILLRGNGIFIAYPESAFGNQPSKYIYESVGDSHILVFNSDEFQELVQKEKSLMKLYIGILREAIMVLNYRVETMITMSNEERYIDLIKRNPQFLESAYKKDIAYYLGITPVSLSRIIKRISNVKK